MEKKGEITMVKNDEDNAKKITLDFVNWQICFCRFSTR